MDDAPGGCPKCGGGVAWEVRPLTEQAAGPRSRNPAAAAAGDAEPACGWLVCVSGPQRGGYYRLINGKTQICGESCLILFDEAASEFWLLNGRGRDVARLNGALLLGAIRLRKGDALKIGKAEYAFVPLYNEHFMWGAF